jgi:hypothetical protein
VSHGELQSIDGFGIVRAASRAKGLGGGEERFDRFVAQNACQPSATYQCRYPYPRSAALMAARSSLCPTGIRAH